MSAPLTGWALAVFILANAAWDIWSTFRARSGAPVLIFNAAINVAVTLLIANAASIMWGSVVPIWLWWLTAALLAVYLASLTYRLLMRTPPRPAAEPAIG